MKKILWTSLFWIVICILFWVYIRFINNDLGTKLSYCLMPNEQTETVDYAGDISLINQQLVDIKDKVEDILQTLGEQPIQTNTEPFVENQATTLPINSVNSLFDSPIGK